MLTLRALDEASEALGATQGQLDELQAKMDATGVSSEAMAGKSAIAADALGASGGLAKGAKDAEKALNDTKGAADDAGKHLGLLESTTQKFGSGMSKIGSSLGNWGIPFSNSLSKTGDKMKNAQASAGTLSEGVTAMAHTITAVGVVGLAAVAAASVKAGMDFQKTTTQLETGAGQSAAGLGAVRSGLLSMAGQVGVSADDLAKGMYMVESAGFHGAAGLTVMKAAAEGGKVGAADMSDVANVLTSALNAYHEPASQAVKVTDELVATVASGKMHMQDLATALSSSMPIAAKAGISLAQLGGAIATMTMQGMSARRASMGLASVISGLENPTAQAQTEMQALGLSVGQVETHLGKAGLTGTINELATAVMKNMGPAGTVLLHTFNQSQSATADLKTELDAMPPSLQKLAQGFESGKIGAADFTKLTANLPTLQANMLAQFESTAKSANGFNAALKGGTLQSQTFAAAMAKMTGGQVGLRTSLMLTGSSASTFDANVKHISASAKAAGTNVQGWGAIQDDLSQQLDQTKASVDAIGIKLGLVLIPYVKEAMGFFVKFVGPILQNKTALLALAVVVGGVFAVAFAVTAVRGVQKFGDAMENALNGMGKVGQAVTRMVPGLNTVAESEEETGAAATEASEAVQRASATLQDVIDTLQAGFERMATIAQESFGKVATAAEDTDAAVEEAMVGGSVTSSVTTAADVVQTQADIMVGSFTEIGGAAEAAEAKVALATEGMETSLAGAAGASEAAGAASAAGGAEIAAGGAAGAAGVATGMSRSVVLSGAEAGAGEVGLTSMSTILPAAIAGLVAFQGTSALLNHNVLGLGSATKSLADGAAKLFGVNLNTGAFSHGQKPGGQTTKYLEELALGLTKSKDISAGTARTDLHSAGISDKQIAASKAALEAAFSPAAKWTEISANDLQIAADKNLEWIAMAQASTDQQRGVSDKSAVAAEKTLQANVNSLNATNQQLSGVQQIKTAATSTQKAATVHLSAAQLHANAAKAAEKAASDTTKASSDMSGAAKALVDGQTKTATMLEAKASKLDTASVDLEKAAELWSGGYVAALSAKGGPATRYAQMNVPKHAEGGVSIGPSFGEFGEAGQEAILPLSNSSAMSSIASAISGAGGAGLPSSQQTIYAIENLNVVANNPQQMQSQLQQQARVSALSSKPMGSMNLGVAT